MRDLFVLRVENQLAKANINRMYRLRPWLNQNEFRFIIHFDQICKRFLHFQTFSNSLTESSNGWKASFFISTPFLRIGHTKLIINISNHVRDEHFWKPIFYCIYMSTCIWCMKMVWKKNVCSNSVMQMAK